MSAPESFAVARLQTADIEALFERLNLSELMESGAVNVIGLDAIRDKIGLERWPRKQAAVWAHVERCMQKTLSPQDIFHRLTDCDYVVAVVSDSPIAAQSLCMRVLEETLVFFLGACKRSDLTLQTVRGFKDGKLDCSLVDAAMVHGRVEGAREDPDLTVARAAGKPLNPLMRFQSFTGQDLRVTHGPEPLISLRQGLNAGVRVEPAVVNEATGAELTLAELGKLDDHDLERIDQATFELGIKVIKLVQSDRPGTILPISFQTLSSSRRRAALFALAPAELVRQRFLIEIVNIDPGTPNGRLIELAGLLRAHTTGVLARVPPAKQALDALRDIRLAGVALDLSEVAADEAALLAMMSAFHNRAVAVAPSLQVLGLPSRGLFGAAMKIGITHASVRRQPSVNLAA